MFIEWVSWSMVRCEDAALPHLELFELFSKWNVLSNILCFPQNQNMQRDRGHRQISRLRWMRVGGGGGNIGEVGRARRGKGSHERGNSKLECDCDEALCWKDQGNVDNGNTKWGDNPFRLEDRS